MRRDAEFQEFYEPNYGRIVAMVAAVLGDPDPPGLAHPRVSHRGSQHLRLVTPVIAAGQPAAITGARRQ